MHKLLQFFTFFLLFTFSIFATPIQYAPIMMGGITSFVPYSHVKVSLGDDKIINEGKNQILTANVTHPEDIVSYEWREGNKLLSTGTTFSTQELSVGVHTVTLTIVDNNGLSVSDEMILEIYSFNNTQSNLIYTGNSNPANLTSLNSQNFMVMTIGTLGNVFSAFQWKKNISSSNSLIKASVALHTCLASSSVHEGVNYGDIGGTLNISIVLHNDKSWDVIRTFKNYRDSNNNGILINGSIIIRITKNHSEITRIDTIYQMLQCVFPNDIITFDGIVEKIYLSDGYKTIENYVVKEMSSRKTIKYENFETYYRKVQSNNAQIYQEILTYSGRLYNYDYGYVDLTTINPRIEYYGTVSRPEGKISFVGDDSYFTAQYAYDDRIRLEVDNNNDGVYEDIIVLHRNDNDILDIIENSAPIIDVTFPDAIYTNTDMNDVYVNVYDPDLDDINVSYEWKVNNIVVSYDKILNNQLFKKHDILTLTVISEDDRIKDHKTTKVIKTQEVLNSPPVVILELDRTNIEVGEKIILDASKSYDVDNDIFEFEWNSENRIYNLYDNAYNMQQKYLEINNNNKSKINFLGNNSNPHYVNEEISPYGVTVKLNDGDVGGVSTLSSNDIFVNNMDLFTKKTIILEDYNILIDAISAIEVVDINQDGLLDIVIVSDFYGQFKDNGKIIIFLQNNLHDFYLYKTIMLDNISPYSYNSLSISDFNGDGLLDIAYTSPTMHGYKILYQDFNGDYIHDKEYFTNIFSYISTPSLPELVQYTSNSVDYLADTDINNDGKMDIITIGSNSMQNRSTGMNIFLQNDINLSDEKMLVLDNRTIEDDGQYEVSDPHTIRDITIKDIDKDGQKDFIVGNYIEYQEDNGTFSEYLYNTVDTISFANLDINKTSLLGVNSFNKKLFIYKQKENNKREYMQSITINIFAANPYQIYGAYIQNDTIQDIVVGHSGSPFFTLYAHNGAEFYDDQIYKLDGRLTLNYSLGTYVKDIDNNGYDDIILMGRRGFEIFYRK